MKIAVIMHIINKCSDRTVYIRDDKSVNSKQANSINLFRIISREKESPQEL